jgi:hypothetical protein
VKEISIGEFARRSRLSLKALRLYDERGVLVPSRVDHVSGYRYYDTAQLDARRELADYLVSRLSGKRSAMYEVATREIPERSLLCLKRNVAVQEQWAFGKEFIAILRERPLPKIEGREGAFFCVYWSHPGADGDGLIEWCKPVPQAEAPALTEHYPELTLRTEPAHLEMFVALPAAYGAVQWNLACESLDAWGQEQAREHEGDRLALTPEDLGLRTTYLATGPSDPGIDLAIPFAVEP